MVVQSVAYQCGCGYRTELLAQAMEHVRKTGHSMKVLGEIRETEPRKPKR